MKAYTCTGCHGIIDYNNSYPTYHVPRIGGQNSEYLVIALQAYQSGKRKHSTMNLQAESLSKQDIEDIAVYLARHSDSHPLKSSDSNALEGQSKSEICQTCHGATGISTQPIYPNLAGQHRDYLSKALNDYRSGARQDPLMSGFAANLSDDDIEDIVSWYANQAGLTEMKDR